jgi:hypothetical protein
VIAAIVDAREVYTDQKWLAWADHWIAGPRSQLRVGQEGTSESPSGMRSRVGGDGRLRAPLPGERWDGLRPCGDAGRAGGLGGRASPGRDAYGDQCDCWDSANAVRAADRTREHADGPQFEVRREVDTPVASGPRSRACPARGLEADAI